MSKDTKNQHVVPRAYLRFFASKRKKEYYIDVFDKKLNKQFNDIIFNVSSQRYFYELKVCQIIIGKRKITKLKTK